MKITPHLTSSHFYLGPWRGSAVVSGGGTSWIELQPPEGLLSSLTDVPVRRQNRG